MAVFQPMPLLARGHRATIAARLMPRRFPNLPPSERRFFRTTDDTSVLAECNWQPNRQGPVLVVLHGLEGGSHSSYMKGLAEKAYGAGFGVIRLNHRNCGDTEHLTPTLYHSGLTDDVAAVIRELVESDGVQQIAVAGYSLGGNVALKLAGEYGRQPPQQLRAVAAVSPPIDLARAAVLLERRSNIVYQWYFLRSLKRRIRRKAAALPERYSTADLNRIRTVRQFDDRYTGPAGGFRDASDYYARASAIRVLADIRVPTLIITAKDDPFVPPEPFDDPRVRGNAAIRVALTDGGGHCGFLARRSGGGDRYWAEREIVGFVRAHVLGSHGEDRPVETSTR